MRTVRGYMSIAAVLLGMAFIPAGHDYPTDYFQLPVNRPIKLSGTFGELRSNHFHAGIDIKTLNGRPGEKIYAAAGGYISRIKVEPGGYGNALYIAHPNGYTTVYTHLDRFVPEVAAYVKSRQYDLKRFSVDLHPRADLFPIYQGEHIAYLGNSGYSFGAHLHFEIRRSAGQIPINPLLFGLPLQDQVRPEIHALKVYYLNDKLGRTHTVDYPVQRVSPGNYKLPAPLVEGAWRIGLGLKVFDQMNGAPNRNGIYSLELMVDGERQYAFTMREMPFNKTRYLNAHLDYFAKSNNEGSFHRCYRVPGNALDMYEEQGQKGIIQLYANQARMVTLTVRDSEANTSTLTFEIQRDTAIWEPPPLHYDYTVSHQQGLHISNDELRVSVPAAAFYEPAFIDYTPQRSEEATLFALRHDIGSEHIPLHTYGRISIRQHGLPKEIAAKAFVAFVDEDGELVSCGGTPEGDMITTRIRSLGSYTIGIDTIKPTISPVFFKSDMRDEQRMTFRIEVNQAIAGAARGLRYRATVDGAWILMEYDAKNDLLVHRFDDRIGPGTHTLQLTVRDDRNNVATFQSGFTR
ncbi:MAG: M23 family metallopeptidase [Saprospiraceae bacterium]|nr:M23 family metallopeptidase [Saprospiraceae bacterium]